MTSENQRRLMTAQCAGDDVVQAVRLIREAADAVRRQMCAKQGESKP